MSKAETLVADLDAKIAASPRFKSATVGEYFRDSLLKWWRPDSSAHHEQENDIAEWLGRHKFIRALEVGPGFGRITGLIVPNTQELTLVEINKRAAKKLIDMFPNATVINGAVEEYESWQGNYDLVVAVSVLMHIPNVPELLNQISRSTVRGGKMIVSIVPASEYKNNRAIIHRGIDPDEFEQSMGTNRFFIENSTKHDKLLTYFAVRR